MTSVLIVDDDDQLRRALVRSLRVNGYESGVARSYDEALQCVQRHSYDVVLTDLRMAGKDGIELVGALSELAPLTKAILMSAFASARDSQRARETGAVDILCKPFDTVEMLRAVDRAAESRSGFRGTVHGLSLLDMLQMFHCAHRSLTLMVAGSPSGFVHMRDGEVIHASHGSDSGKEALQAILKMPAGSLETRALEEGVATVTEPFPTLLEELMANLPSGVSVQGTPSDIMSIIEGAATARASTQVKLPPDPPFPDVFGELNAQESNSQPTLSEPPTGIESNAGELAIARDLRQAVPGAQLCAVLALRDEQCVHYSGRSPSEPAPIWLDGVRELLAVAPTASDEPLPIAGDPLGSPEVGELQLALSDGVLLAKVTQARRSAVLLVVRAESGLPAAWAQLREAVRNHESIEGQ